jgi:hypothetical protein
MLTPLNLGGAVWAQQAAFRQDSIENTSSQTGDRLDTIIELLEQSRQGDIIQLNLTIIVFMMGLAFVIFGLYIGQEQKLSVFTKRLYLIAYFALIVPITIILVCTYRTYHYHSCTIYCQCSDIWQFKRSSSECCVLTYYSCYGLVRPNDS